jgi:molybdenum cofactor synthesis domain-containing protein
MYTVGIIVLSDKGSKGEREDLSGPKIMELLPKDQYEIKSYKVIPDEKPLIEYELIRLSDEQNCNLVLTSGGTGLSPRDVTPEATLAVADRNVPGIAEAIRYNSMQYTKRAMLSRAVSVARRKTLIINLPGSPKAVAECLEYILSELPHAIGILCGTDGECARK